MPRRQHARHLVLILGDQLDADSAALADFDAERDAVWMAEVAGEATQVWNHKARIAIFLAAMRHFRDALRQRGYTVHYRDLEDRDNCGTLAEELAAAIARHKPEKLIVVEPGEWRVQEALVATANEHSVPLEIRADTHFFTTKEDFAAHTRGRKQLRLEYFYRELRQRFAVLMDGDDPIGGEWNFDHDNRGTFGKRGPGEIPAPLGFPPDKITREVLALVERKFPQHPGKLEHFDWPVTAADAQRALNDFITHRLANFGQYQDALWTDEPFLYHSLLSAAMNLKLLNPRAVVAAAEEAYHAGRAPLNAVEGFIRQILGWREYVRGIYWHFMPQYLERNALGAQEKLPDFYWTGETDMQCLRQAITQTLDYGYAHHIQRLMVTGLFALLLGVHPREVHEWYLAVYVDAVEWVELPNTLGMSQFGDGGIMASKPYAASGKYIQRMSNYCTNCRFDPNLAVGENACPFTTLYWDFLARHQKLLSQNRRMALQVKNLEKKAAEEVRAIRAAAANLRDNL